MKFVFAILISYLSFDSSDSDLISIANTLLNDRNYVEAKSAIDEAFDDPGLFENPRAWYTKGRIYHEILKDDQVESNELIKDRSFFIEETINAYIQTKKLTDKAENLHILATNQIEILWADGINNGVSRYKAGDFKGALKHFEISVLSKPSDTLGYLYSGLSAQNAGLYKEAIGHYLNLRNFTELSKEAYNGLIMSSQALNDTDAQMKYLDAALIAYPRHLPYILEKSRVLVRNKRYKEAESLLNSSVVNHGDNPVFILRQADLFDRLFKASYINGEPELSNQYFENAITKYELYLEQYPNDFAANYNYSVMLNEKANKLYVQVNLMDDTEYQINGKKTEQEGHEWTRKALPYMEKAKSLKPNNEKVLLALNVYYDRLNMTEKLLALKQ